MSFDDRPMINFSLSLREAMDLYSALSGCNFLAEGNVEGVAAWLGANGSQPDIDARDILALRLHDLYHPIAKEMVQRLMLLAEEEKDRLAADE